MSKVCAVCGKGKTFEHNVSHSNRKANRTWDINLQQITIVEDGKEKKVKACTKCIKTNRK